MTAIMRALIISLLAFTVAFSSCYSFKDVSIPPQVKTARVNYIENRASYVNPQLSPQLTDRLRQKINNQTRLTLVATDEADYDIYGEVRGYTFSTAGISDQRPSTNRLQVTVHIVFKNRLDEKANFEADVTRSFDFNANQNPQQAEQALSEDILKNMTDEIFNRIFSNW
jgi:hypothetical protein